MKSKAAGYEVQIDCDDGWTSGRKELLDGLEVELPLRAVGEHRFRATVFDPRGRPVASASAELMIVRTYASARGIRATHHLAVKVRESEFRERNTLDIFLQKGADLPDNDELPVRAARTLKSGEAGHVDIEIYEQDRPEAPQPELSLFVGTVRIEGSDLPEGSALRKGDPIILHWFMDDRGILTASVELPEQRLRLPERRFYVPQTQRSFEGEDGARLAASALDQAEHDLEQAEAIVGDGSADELESLRRQLARQRDQQTFDADSNRSVAEGARHLRQDVASLVRKPDHRAAAMAAQLTELKSAFNYQARELADARQAKRFDGLADSAAREIEGSRFDTAEQAIEEMRALTLQVMWSEPSFVAEVFNSATEETYLAVDPELHARQVEAGRKALLRGDIDGLREIVFEMIRNRVSLPASGKAATVLATIMRA